jgi:hypothetical protein
MDDGDYDTMLPFNYIALTYNKLQEVIRYSDDTKLMVIQRNILWKRLEDCKRFYPIPTLITSLEKDIIALDNRTKNSSQLRS